MRKQPNWFALACGAATLLVLLLPSTAAAQRDPFFSALLNFYGALNGVYGDEGPRLSASLEAMSTALVRWDEEIEEWERQMRPATDAQTALQVHTFLASLYMERGRFDDALREFAEDVKLDPRRAAFPRFSGLIHQLAARPDAAADAFRTAWQLDPSDPQNAYRLIAFRSARATDEEASQALETLRTVERDLLSGAPRPAGTWFVNIAGVRDDAGGGMAFVPAAYARGFALVLAGRLDAGVAELRAELATDPLVADSASRAPTTAEGLNALREGRIADAIEQLEKTVAHAGDSSQGHRMLATAYVTSGDIAKAIEHYREAIRLNARDERSWVALVRTLDQAGRVSEAQQLIRDALAVLPDSGALRWQLAAFAAREQRTVPVDVALIAAADRYVLLAGRADLQVSLARFARTQLEFQREIALLQQAIAINANNAAAHKALARAYIDQGREVEGYAELVVALLLDPDDPQTYIALGRHHLAAGRLEQAIAILQRSNVLQTRQVDGARALGEALVRAGKETEGRQRLAESERLQAQTVDDERRQRRVATLSVEAEVRMTERDYAVAIDLWQQVIALPQTGASPVLRLADALVAAKRLDEAAKMYQQAISLGASADAYRRLADVYRSLSRPEDAAREQALYVSRQLDDIRRRATGNPR